MLISVGLDRKGCHERASWSFPVRSRRHGDGELAGAEGGCGDLWPPGGPRAFPGQVGRTRPVTALRSLGTTPGRPPALRIKEISGTAGMNDAVTERPPALGPLPRRLSRNVADTIGSAVPNPPLPDALEEALGLFAPDRRLTGPVQPGSRSWLSLTVLPGVTWSGSMSPAVKRRRLSLHLRRPQQRPPGTRRRRSGLAERRMRAQRVIGKLVTSSSSVRVSR